MGENPGMTAQRLDPPMLPRVIIFAALLLVGRTSEGWPAKAVSCAAVIPNPNSVECRRGSFALRPDTALVVPAGDAEARAAARRFATLP